MFRATAEVEKTKATVNDKRYELFIEEGKAKAELELKKADLNIQQVLRMLALEQDALKTLMHTHAQLAASAMSAVNLAANIGESASLSSSCSDNYSY
jgi:topoisomerase IA-like protein